MFLHRGKPAVWKGEGKGTKIQTSKIRSVSITDCLGKKKFLLVKYGCRIVAIFNKSNFIFNTLYFFSVNTHYIFNTSHFCSVNPNYIQHFIFCSVNPNYI